MDDFIAVVGDYQSDCVQWMMSVDGDCIVVNGDWSAWSMWGSCSVTCAQGVSQRSRVCNQPAPARGGNDCQGVSTQQQACTGAPCPGNTSTVYFVLYIILIQKYDALYSQYIFSSLMLTMSALHCRMYR